MSSRISIKTTDGSIVMVDKNEIIRFSNHGDQATLYMVRGKSHVITDLESISKIEDAINAPRE